MQDNYPCDKCRSTCTGCKSCPAWLNWFARSWQESVMRIKGEKQRNTDFEIQMVKHDEI